MLLTASVTHASCSEEQDVPAAGEWLTIATDLQEFTFEGGTKELEYVLQEGYDEADLQLSLTLEGEKGKAQIAEAMRSLRETPPSALRKAAYIMAFFTQNICHPSFLRITSCYSVPCAVKDK